MTSFSHLPRLRLDTGPTIDHHGPTHCVMRELARLVADLKYEFARWPDDETLWGLFFGELRAFDTVLDHAGDNREKECGLCEENSKVLTILRGVRECVRQRGIAAIAFRRIASLRYRFRSCR